MLRTVILVLLFSVATIVMSVVYGEKRICLNTQTERRVYVVDNQGNHACFRNTGEDNWQSFQPGGSPDIVVLRSLGFITD